LDYLSVEEARERDGVRLVLTAGVPGPWGEALKAILHCKGIDYLPVRQEAGGANEALLAWTGQTSAPVLLAGEGPPVCHWLDQLHLAESLASTPALLPADPEARAEVIGLSALIAGREGFGWQRRLLLLAPGMQQPEPPVAMVRMATKYGWSPAALDGAVDALGSICGALDRRLARQAAAGSDYFVGGGLTAVDIYWANFAGMVCPLPPEHNPLSAGMRAVYESGGEAVRGRVTPRLLAHRDRIYARHLKLPLEF
jgi:glutathione S-transferase